MKISWLRQIFFISWFHCFNGLAKVLYNFRKDSFSTLKMETGNSNEFSGE